MLEADRGMGGYSYRSYLRNARGAKICYIWAEEHVIYYVEDAISSCDVCLSQRGTVYSNGTLVGVKKPEAHRSAIW